MRIILLLTFSPLILLGVVFGLLRYFFILGADWFENMMLGL